MSAQSTTPIGESCAKVQPLLETFKDGELGADSLFAVEAHLSSCERCREELKLLEAIHWSLRDAALADGAVNQAFLGRLHGSLDAERKREAEEEALADQTVSLKQWKARLFPALAVAAAALAWIWQPTTRQVQPEERSVAGASQEANVSSGAGSVQALLDKLVDYHSHPPAPQVTEESLVPRFEEEVGVRVELPRLAQFGARWTGGSVVPVNNRHAAFLDYDLPGYDAPRGRRITVYVYDSERVPVHASLEPRIVRDQPVYVGRRRGYTIAARQGSGIGYAIATDLNDTESAEIVASLGTMH